MPTTRLIVQPGDGIDPFIRLIAGAQSEVDTTVFRMDLAEVEESLRAAVARGVAVRTLVAHANRGGTHLLRLLERRLRLHGILSQRTADDLFRYHGKLLIVDRAVLGLMLFNYTVEDMVASRSFALLTDDSRLVAGALRVFEADLSREPLRAVPDPLVVSPLNARPALARLIRSARRRLLVYDPHLADATMSRLLHERAVDGVEVRIIGNVEHRLPGLDIRKLRGLRLHARVIVCDDTRAFLGSQGLARMELDARREVGAIVDGAEVIGALRDVFEADWAQARPRPGIVMPRRAWQPERVACLS
jgi:phosphatidylserine/phosphatidylglycerophosphate/cardiolipin synthase-like enzyme